VALDKPAYYVGQTTLDINERFIQHAKSGRGDYNTLLANAIFEYGTRSFTIEIIDKTADIDFARKLETKYILEYKSHYKDGHGGYNMKYEQPDNYVPYYHNEKDITKIQENINSGKAWNYGIAFSNEAKQKISKTKRHRMSLGLYTNYGHKLSNEAKKKISDKAKARGALSEEHKQKISKQSSNRIWIHNPDLKLRKLVKSIDNLDLGWVLGKGTYDKAK
jgi:group I intron endonuclease